MGAFLPVRLSFLRIATFGVLAATVSCQSQPSRIPDSTAPSPSLMRIQGLDVQEQSSARTLAATETLHVQQEFAIRLDNGTAMHLCVVLEHADKRRALLYPHPGDPAGATAPGSVRLPKAGDWFSVERADPLDRLCLIGSEAPTDQLFCTEQEAPKGPDRGEDTPPPPAKKGEKPSAPPSSPPPDDQDGSRGRRRWVILLPFTVS